MKHLTSLLDLTPDELLQVLNRAEELKQELRRGHRPQLFPGHVLVQLFEKPSLRTRNSFEAAMIHLGGAGIFQTTAEAGLNGRESLSDVAKVISSFADIITMRTFSQQLIEDFAKHSSCPVINGLSDDRHPCQALTDLLTIREHRGQLTGLHLVFVGDGNNVSMSLALAAAMTGMQLTLAAPVGFEFTSQFMSLLTSRYPKHCTAVVHDPVQAVRTADIVYTDVWASMGQEAEQARREKAFAGYQLDRSLLDIAAPDAIYLHCLPAHRGEEISAELVDAPDTVIWDEAENRLHAQKALVEFLLTAS
ncbi:MAG: ornithine carbamoyltransferase [Planctomyces sp.]